MSLLLSGGGMPMGQAVGSTNARGEEPRDRPVTPNDFQATLYRYLGVPLDTEFTDQAGRPCRSCVRQADQRVGRLNAIPWHRRPACGWQTQAGRLCHEKRQTQAAACATRRGLDP